MMKIDAILQNHTNLFENWISSQFLKLLCEVNLKEKATQIIEKRNMLSPLSKIFIIVKIYCKEMRSSALTFIFYGQKKTRRFGI